MAAKAGIRLVQKRAEAHGRKQKGDAVRHRLRLRPTNTSEDGGFIVKTMQKNWCAENRMRKPKIGSGPAAAPSLAQGGSKLTGCCAGGLVGGPQAGASALPAAQSSTAPIIA